MFGIYPTYAERQAARDAFHMTNGSDVYEFLWTDANGSGLTMVTHHSHLTSRPQDSMRAAWIRALDQQYGEASRQ